MQSKSIQIRPANLGERSALEDLQWRSSLHFPAYAEELRAHPDPIELPPEQILSGLVRVAEQGDTVVGFSVPLAAVGGACKLDGLFVEPGAMRTGIGTLLIADAVRIASESGTMRIEVVANPQAVAFYA